MLLNKGEYMRLIILLFLVSCGTHEVNTRSEEIGIYQEDLRVLYEEYLTDLERYNITPTHYTRLIYYAQLPDRIVGRCYFNEELGNVVVIDPAVQAMPLYSQRFIMYHELGHCLHNFTHIDDKGLHIMNTAVNMINPEISERWGELVNTLLDGNLE